MHYDKGKHTVFHHRYIIWSGLRNTDIRSSKAKSDFCVRELARQVCAELDVDIISGVLSAESYPYVCLDPPKAVGKLCDAADQGADIPQNPDGISGPAKKILGQTVLGTGIFLYNKRTCHPMTSYFSTSQSHTPADNSTGISR